MDEFTANAFVNREEPIPVVTVNNEYSEDGESDGQADSNRKRDRLKKHTSNLKENIWKRTTESGSSVQDRLLEKFVSVFLCS